ncbi:winged helix-turn-helix transcriptional regulator [Candidatus Kaiserbacteria bacterium]|nr:winged helix-turn-helix transcriptional regulator [Candidatus Kaiserbacteria bacterium]
MDRELKELGLLTKEIVLYKTCLSNEESSPTELARKTGIKHATLYAYLEKLREKGLIEFRAKGARRRILATTPQRGLKQLIQHKKEQLDKQEASAVALIKMIEEIPRVQRASSRVFHYWGDEGLSIAAEKVLSAQRNLRWVGSIETLLSLVGEKRLYKSFTQKRLRQKTVSYAITDKRIFKYKQFSEMIGNRRLFRFFENEFKIPAVLIIYGEHVCLVSKQENNASVVVIEDEVIGQMATFLFETLWASLART